MVIFLAIIIAVLSGLIFWLWRKKDCYYGQFQEQKNEIARLNSLINLYQDKIIKDLEQKNQQIFTENQILLRENSRLQADLVNISDRLTSQKQEIIELHQRSQQNFENIANKILQEKSDKFTEINHKNISQILDPLGKNIENFKKQVAEVYDKDSKERIVLQEEVKKLFEQTNKISSEANNLASALKGSSKKQGNWGEMILETILQYSGLQKDVNYFKEQSFNNEEGKNLRPDFIINLPDNRVIITDSKVSLNAYDKFCHATNDFEAQNFLQDHLKALRNHIDNLASKQYHKKDKSLDFIIMFMPIEPAYLLAIQADSTLWADAYEKRILLVSPTNLIACLKIIDDLWKREKQSKNALEIVKCGEGVYNKLVSFVDSFVKIGNGIESSLKNYHVALGQLKEGRGSLIGRAEELKNLGLKTDKKIAIESSDLDIIENHLENLN